MLFRSAEMVFHRRAGEGDALMCLERLRGLIRFCFRVFERLRFVEEVARRSGASAGKPREAQISPLATRGRGHRHE